MKRIKARGEYQQRVRRNGRDDRGRHSRARIEGIPGREQPKEEEVAIRRKRSPRGFAKPRAKGASALCALALALKKMEI